MSLLAKPRASMMGAASASMATMMSTLAMGASAPFWLAGPAASPDWSGMEVEFEQARRSVLVLALGQVTKHCRQMMSRRWRCVSCEGGLRLACVRALASRDAEHSVPRDALSRAPAASGTCCAAPRSARRRRKSTIDRTGCPFPSSLDPLPARRPRRSHGKRDTQTAWRPGRSLRLGDRHRHAHRLKLQHYPVVFEVRACRDRACAREVSPCERTFP